MDRELALIKTFYLFCDQTSKKFTEFLDSEEILEWSMEEIRETTAIRNACDVLGHYLGKFFQNDDESH